MKTNQATGAVNTQAGAATQPSAAPGDGQALIDAAKDAIKWLNSWFRNHDGNKIADKLSAALTAPSTATAAREQEAMRMLWEDQSAEEKAHYLRVVSRGQAPASPMSPEQFLDMGLADVQDEGGTLTYYSKEAVLECIAAALASPAALPSAEPVEMSPEFTDSARSALLWVLWHHQGASSKVGQPIRFALGMGQFDRLNEHQLAEAKRWGGMEAPTSDRATGRGGDLSNWLDGNEFHRLCEYYRNANAATAREAYEKLQEGIERATLASRPEAPAAPSAEGPTLPEGWNLVEKKTCYVLQEGNVIVATLAGPDAEENAARIAAVLYAPIASEPQPIAGGISRKEEK